MDQSQKKNMERRIRVLYRKGVVSSSYCLFSLPEASPLERRRFRIRWSREVKRDRTVDQEGEGSALLPVWAWTSDGDGAKARRKRKKEQDTSRLTLALALAIAIAIALAGASKLVDRGDRGRNRKLVKDHKRERERERESGKFRDGFCRVFLDRTRWYGTGPIGQV